MIPAVAVLEVDDGWRWRQRSYVMRMATCWDWERRWPYIELLASFSCFVLACCRRGLRSPSPSTSKDLGATTHSRACANRGSIFYFYFGMPVVFLLLGPHFAFSACTAMLFLLWTILCLCEPKRRRFLPLIRVIYYLHTIYSNLRSLLILTFVHDLSLFCYLDDSPERSGGWMF